MKILITVLFVCILLTGCEKKEKIYTVGLFGSNVVGDSYGVKIDNIWLILSPQSPEKSSILDKNIRLRLMEIALRGLKKLFAESL